MGWNRRFGGTYRIRLHGQRVRQAKLAVCVFCILLNLILVPEDKGDLLLRNVELSVNRIGVR
jgi:hypothetical protein